MDGLVAKFLRVERHVTGAFFSGRSACSCQMQRRLVVRTLGF